MLHFCVCEGQGIFLDRHCNRYFSLSPAENRAFVSAVGDTAIGTVAHRSLLALLSTEVPLAKAGHDQGIAMPPRAAKDRLAKQAAIKPPITAVFLAFASRVAAAILLKFLPLRLILAYFESSASGRCVDADAKLDRIAAAFRLADRWLGTHNKCLSRTLAFAWLCKRIGRQPNILIGVRIRPFSAHCWSQAGETVLNDRLDNVRPYQAILVA